MSSLIAKVTQRAKSGTRRGMLNDIEELRLFSISPISVQFTTSIFEEGPGIPVISYILVCRVWSFEVVKHHDPQEAVLRHDL